MVHRVEREPRLRTSCLLRDEKDKFQIYISKFLGFQIIYVNFRLLSPTDSGRASRSVVGNWNFRPMSVARQKIDVGPDFGRKFGALGVSNGSWKLVCCWVKIYPSTSENFHPRVLGVLAVAPQPKELWTNGDHRRIQRIK